jgi:hypothetical protein
MSSEHCSLCGCSVHRDGNYATPNAKGRSHATKHHYVAERFYGRSKNRPGTSRDGVSTEDPWGVEGESAVFCYDCHEEILHNPVILPEDIAKFSEVVRLKGLDESEKDDGRDKLGGRIKLFHEIIAEGLDVVLREAKKNSTG